MEHKRHNITLESGTVISFTSQAEQKPIKSQIINVQNCLERALAREDYETACILRDDITKLKAKLI